MASLKDQTVLIVGRGSGLARAIALAVLDAGGRVIAAGRDQEGLSAAYAGERRLGRPRRAGQGRLLHPGQHQQSRPAHRHPRGHRAGRSVRPDQHLPHRPDPARRRRRAPHL